MASQWQKQFQLPLLFEVATRYEVSVGSWGDDLTEIYKDIRRYFTLPGDYLAETVGRGEPRFQNDVLWAKKQLQSNGELDVQPRRSWTVTNQGLDRLKDAIGPKFRDHQGEWLRKFVLSRDENDSELLLHLLRLAPEETIRSCIQDSNDIEELFLNSWDALPPNVLHGFLISGYEQIRELLGWSPDTMK